MRDSIIQEKKELNMCIYGVEVVVWDTDHKLIPGIEDGIDGSIHCHLVAQVSGLGIWELNTGNGGR